MSSGAQIPARSAGARSDLRAAALLHSLARNHALIDGNKRTAFLAAALMLERNGVVLAVLPDEQEPVMIAVAVGDMDVPEIAEHLRKWSE
ncbi:type II toxin-antitoxin system death-on-curing family toxin [Nocardia sp. CA-107356]|uniref:type II toxin-antitoxin system death-on-curing family toxin n=1 Tax=Nocardia sp. CA-107356 TaxID=3239972 RepID=UPI003D8A1CC2